VAAGLYVEQVVINRSLHIHGQGADFTIVDGNNTGRVFMIEPGVTVTLAKMTIQHGLAPRGGGIWVYQSTLTLQEVMLTENSSLGDGGGLLGTGIVQLTDSVVTGNEAATEGAGLASEGILTVTNSIISHNSSAGFCSCNIGGGIFSRGGRLAVSNSLVYGNIGSFGGGGIYYDAEGIFTLDNTVVSNNDRGGIQSHSGAVTITLSAITNNQGSGIHNDAPSFGGSVTIINSTISGNATIYDGGGILNEQYGSLTIIGSTISNNSADNGGGIYLKGPTTGVPSSILNTTISGNTATEVDGFGGYGGGIGNVGTLTLTNVTIAGNTAPYGAGLYSASPLNLINTIIANNLSGTNCGSSVPLTSQGNNLASDSSCNLTASGDQQGVNPLLAPLANNGGPTWTHALLPGSPAIDTGSQLSCPATDQRGIPRPIDGDGNSSPICDIGAYEYNPTASP
jgi:hypothetical protein